MPSAWSLISSFLICVAGFTQLATAQQITILSPNAGTTLKPGQNFEAVLHAQSTSSSAQTIALVFGLNARGNQSPPGSLGKVTLQTFAKGDLQINTIDSTYTVQLTVPPAYQFRGDPSSNYDLVMAQYLLLGATQSPVLYTNSTSVIVAA